MVDQTSGQHQSIEQLEANASRIIPSWDIPDELVASSIVVNLSPSLPPVESPSVAPAATPFDTTLIRDAEDVLLRRKNPVWGLVWAVVGIGTVAAALFFYKPWEQATKVRPAAKQKSSYSSINIPKEPEPPRPKTAPIRFNLLPSNLTLEVDGQVLVSTENVELELGRVYHLRLSARGYQTKEQTLTVKEPTVVNLNLEPLEEPPKELAAKKPASKKVALAKQTPNKKVRTKKEREASPKRKAPGAGFVTNNPY